MKIKITQSFDCDRTSERFNTTLKYYRMNIGGDGVIDVAERIKVLMEERGLNMNTLAKRSNMSWNTINNFYARETIPTLPTLSLICDALGITLAQFFDEDGETVTLTAEQKHVIERWDRLTDREKMAVSETIDIILQNRE